MNFLERTHTISGYVLVNITSTASWIGILSWMVWSEGVTMNGFILSWSGGLLGGLMGALLGFLMLVWLDARRARRAKLKEAMHQRFEDLEDARFYYSHKDQRWYPTQDKHGALIVYHDAVPYPDEVWEGGGVDGVVPPPIHPNGYDPHRFPAG